VNQQVRGKITGQRYYPHSEGYKREETVTRNIKFSLVLVESIDYLWSEVGHRAWSIAGSQ
jgi:hypothetical protein